MLLTFVKQFNVKFSDLWGRGSDSEEEKKGYRDTKPPELDRLWRRFNERVNRIFRRKRGGSEPDPAKEGSGIFITFLVFLVGIVWLSNGTYMVPDGHVGIVMTFGKHTDTTSAGLRWRWPYPFQSHEVVNVFQVRRVEVGYRVNEKNRQPKEALMLTRDGNIVEVQFALQYKLKSANDWAFNHRDKDDLIRQVAEAVIREVVGRNTMEYLLYDGKDKMAAEIGQSVQALLDGYATGVQITSAAVQTVQPPPLVQSAHDEIAKAKLEAEKQKNEGLAYANDVLPKARAAAARLMQDAEAYRAHVVAVAEGDAARFKSVLAEYQKAPAVTRDRLYIETMQHIYTNASKVVVDTKGGSNLHLPLDKLMTQMTAKESAKPAGVTAPASEKTPPAPGAAPAAPPAPAASPASVPSSSSSSSAAASAPAAADTRARESRNRETRQ